MGETGAVLVAGFAVALLLLGVFFVGSPVATTSTATRAVGQLLEAHQSLVAHRSTKDPSAPAPSVRWGPMMVWDPIDQYVLLFGGSSGGNQTWKFIDGNWTELHPTLAPSTRAYGGIAYDPQLDAVVLFGGRHVVTIDGTPYTTELNDTWTYAQGVWTNITSSVGPDPVGRESMGFTYDTADGYLLLFGGVGQTSDYLNDTWALEDEKWVDISAAHSPPVRYALAMVFDPADGYVLLYGGIGQVGSKQPYYNETWSYRAGVWTNITYLPAPTGRAWTMLAYYGSGSNGYVMVFGGQANHHKTPTTAQNTTYQYSAGVWTNVTPAYSPGTRFGGGMAYDPVDGYMVLFGGLNATTVIAHALDDTWTWNSGTWTNVTAGSYSVTFTESGLPTADQWYVNVTGGPHLVTTGATTALTTNRPNGGYTFTVATNDKTYAPSYYSGSVIVHGAPATASPVTFSSFTYSVTFSETGLPSGTSWSVTINSATRSSTSATITFQEVNGTYDYTVSIVVGGNTTASFIVNGAPLALTVAFEEESLFGQTWSNYTYHGVTFGFHLWCARTPGAGEVCGNATDPSGAVYSYSFWDGPPSPSPSWQAWVSPNGHEAVQYRQDGLVYLLVLT